MRKRPGDKPYPAERARQRTLTKRLVSLIGLLLGVVFGLLLVRYWGG
jgi:hypothetical protein